MNGVTQPVVLKFGAQQFDRILIRMKQTISRALSLLLIGFTFWSPFHQNLTTHPAQAAVQPVAQQVKTFVQNFYNWYRLLAQTDHNVSTIELALQRKRFVFSRQLRALLDKDIRASHQVSGEVVGLDFDPILDSQEVPAPKYEVGSVNFKKGAYWVTVWASNGHQRTPKPTCILEIGSEDGHWVIQNVHYEDTGFSENENLITLLQTLAKERTYSNY